MGPPRSGKSWGLAMPVLRTWPGSVVVSDLRHELFDQTAQARAAYGPVYCYDPANTTNSCNLNVLDSVRWGTPQAYGDAHRICHHLIVPQRDREPGPFDRPAVALLTGVVLHLHDLGAASFPGVVAWMQAPQRSQREKLEEMLHSANPHVASAARRVLDESDRYRSIVWDAALAPLQVFLDDTVASHSRTSDLDWQDFLSGRHPTSLYLCMSFRDIDRLGVILGALVEALIALLGSPERQPRHRTLLLLDELANLGTLTELERGVSYLQGSGVQLMACVQNLPQLLSLYGLQSPLLASIHTQIHFRPLDRLTAEYLEAMLGPTTVLSQSWGQTQTVSFNDYARGTSASQHEQARPLLTAEEIRRLPFDMALVLHAGCAPVRARKLGVPQPSLPVRVWQSAVAHRETSATLAAAALVLLALIPALRPVVQQPPGARPVVAQAPTLTQATLFPTPAAPTPPPQDDASTRQALAQAAPPAEARPWKFMLTNSSMPSNLQANPRGRYTTREACELALEHPWGDMATQWEHEAKLGQKGVVVWRRDGKLHWERIAGSQQVINEAWCEKD
jgi:hypothetical protein